MLYLNWLLTKEAGEPFSRATGNPSMRADVPTDFIEPWVVPLAEWPASDTEESLRAEAPSIDASALRDLPGPAIQWRCFDGHLKKQDKGVRDMAGRFSIWKRTIVVALLPAAFFKFVDPAVAADAKSFQQDWERTLQAAKQEGQVTLYASQAYEEVFREFQKKFPEVQVNMVVGNGGPSAQRILSERRAGKNIADLYLSGAATGYNSLYKGRVLDPIKPLIVLPEVTDESKWWRGRHKYMDDEKMHLFAFNEVVLPFVAYNSKMANPAEFASYWDLLNPKWKGKIAAMDPTMGSAVDTHLVFITSSPALGPNYLHRLLAEMDITASRDARQIVDWLGSGRHAISLFTTPSRADLNIAKDQGLPVDWLGPKSLKEGTGTSTSNGNVGLINRAPHPNAAKVAINWLLTREGQILYQKAQYGADSLRIDIPKNQVAAYARRQEGAQYIETDAPERRNMDVIRKIIDEAWKKRR